MIRNETSRRISEGFFRRFQELWWNNGTVSCIIVQKLCLRKFSQDGRFWAWRDYFSGWWNIMIPFTQINSAKSFPMKNKWSGTSGRRHQAFGSCLCEDEGICQLGRNWIFVWHMFQGLKLKYIEIQQFFAGDRNMNRHLAFFSHSAWYLSSSCWMLIAIDGYHEATSLDLQSLGYETKCLGWKHGDMGLMGLMGGGYGGLVVLWIW